MVSEIEIPLTRYRATRRMKLLGLVSHQPPKHRYKKAAQERLDTPMERFFRSLKTEWIPKIGYPSFNEEKQGVVDYILDCYNPFRPHTHNGGLAHDVAEKRYWKTQKPVAKMT